MRPPTERAAPRQSRHEQFATLDGRGSSIADRGDAYAAADEAILFAEEERGASSGRVTTAPGEGTREE